MAPYSKHKKVNDVEHPMTSNILGRDILGINANIPAINKTSIDTQDEELSMDFNSKIK